MFIRYHRFPNICVCTCIAYTAYYECAGYHFCFSKALRGMTLFLNERRQRFLFILHELTQAHCRHTHIFSVHGNSAKNVFYIYRRHTCKKLPNFLDTVYYNNARRRDAHRIIRHHIIICYPSEILFV